MLSFKTALHSGVSRIRRPKTDKNFRKAIEYLLFVLRLDLAEALAACSCVSFHGTTKVVFL